MGIPNVEELTELIALIAYGLACREAFHRRVQVRSEEGALKILWAVIWSAPLQLLYSAFGLPPWTLFGLIQTPDQLKLASFVYNVVFSVAIGALLGTGFSYYIRWRRYGAGSHGRWLAPIAASWLGRQLPPPPKPDLSQEWLQYRANSRWVLVETKDGRAFRGWIQLTDQEQDRATNLHFVLAEPVLYDLGTGALHDTVLGEEMLLSMNEVKIIRLL